MAFREPIVVFESDDWGKTGMEAEVELPTQFGERTRFWSYDRLETAEELESLFALLQSYASRVERPPVFTANFIVSNPDVATTQRSQFSTLHLKPIDESHPQLLETWKMGIEKKVFYPQYHGRLHYNAARYLHDLQKNDALQKLFLAGIQGGRELFNDGQFGYYSEYQNYETEATPVDLHEWIAAGLADFSRIFGFESTTTVCPNYVINVRDLAPFANTSIKFLQAGNKFLRQQDGAEVLTNYCQGTKLTHGLTSLARNHKFEPCREKHEWQADFSIKSAMYWMNKGIPAVLDTHRLNYIGKFAENSRAQLKRLLDELTKIPNVRFLTSPELGEAITNTGLYTDVFTGKKVQLTPLDSTIKRKLRQWLH